jgi:glycosyltransferase involved in cell wall biosynthesis
MRVAVIHEWLTTFAGSEQVLKNILSCYPGAELFCMVDYLNAEHRGFLDGVPITTSFIQKLPFSRRCYRQYLPLMPLAVEQFDLSPFDLVISSNHAVAKGALTHPNQLHISYVHSPMRYAWDLQHQYLEQGGLRGLKGAVARVLLHRLRTWDVLSASRVDRFVANSRYIASRIWKTYRREAAVIYPPVETSRCHYSADKSDYYIAISRFVPYKRMDIVVDAFSQMPEKALLIIGDGPELARIKRTASSNVKFLGYQSDEALRRLLAKARAFVFAAIEDFGIVLVEALASGTPVIAYGRGGAVEIVKDLGTSDPTGVLFTEQSAESLVAAVRLFEANSSRISPIACRSSADNFSVEKFKTRFTDLVQRSMAAFRKQPCAEPSTLGQCGSHRGPLNGG